MYIKSICNLSYGVVLYLSLIHIFRNLFAVWILTVFWHGASWNFIVWGLLLFLIISVERLGLLLSIIHI